MIRSRWRSGANLILYSLFGCAVIVGLNLVALGHHASIDMTERAIYTLTERSARALERLAEKEGRVEAIVFTRKEQRRAANDLLKLYGSASDNFRYRIVDLNDNPDLAERYGVTQYGVVALDPGAESPMSLEKTIEISEEAITEALIRMTDPNKRALYFLTGFGGAKLTDSGPDGYLDLATTLGGVGYEARSFNIYESGLIPEDADIVALLGPETDIDPGSQKALERYLDGGGSILLGIDPGPRFERIAALAERYCGAILNDTLVDPVSQSLGFAPLIATATEYDETSPITEKLNLASFFPLARSVEAIESDRCPTAKVIARSSASSWGEVDIASIEANAPVYLEGVDAPGPRPLIVTSEWEAGTSKSERKIGEPARLGRMVLIGDSDFVSNSDLGLNAHGDLALNIVAWLSKGDAGVLPARSRTGFEPLLFGERDMIALAGIFILGIPLLTAAFGLIALRRRRRRAD